MSAAVPTGPREAGGAAGEAVPDWLGRLVAVLPEAGAALAGHLRQREEAALAEGVRLGSRQGRRAAVLVLFGPFGPFGPDGTGGDVDVLLTERSSGLRSHAGQVSFPGGGLEPGDDGDPVAAALREAQEEVGLDAASVQVLGTMPALWVPPTGTLVVPVVAWAPRPAPLGVADPAEVARVLRVPLCSLLDPDARGVVRTRSGWTGPTFSLPGGSGGDGAPGGPEGTGHAPAAEPLVVWGFTAAVLDVLLRMAGLEVPWDRGREVPLASVSGAASLTPAPPGAADEEVSR